MPGIEAKLWKSGRPDKLMMKYIFYVPMSFDKRDNFNEIAVVSEKNLIISAGDTAYAF